MSSRKADSNIRQGRWKLSYKCESYTQDRSQDSAEPYIESLNKLGQFHMGRHRQLARELHKLPEKETIMKRHQDIVNECQVSRMSKERGEEGDPQREMLESQFRLYRVETKERWQSKTDFSNYPT